MILGQRNVPEAKDGGLLFGAYYVSNNNGTNIFTRGCLKIFPFSEFVCVVNVKCITVNGNTMYINDD